MDEPDEKLRMAKMIVYLISRITFAGDILSKPFNPLLGETYELVTTKYRFVAE